MHVADHGRDGRDIMIHLRVRHDQRRRDLQAHEVVAADLTEDAMVPEEPHHHHLSEHSGMDQVERFERGAQQQRPRRLEFESAEQSEAADFRHHLIFGEALPQHLAQLVALRGGARAELFVLQYVQRRQPARIASPFSLYVEVWMKARCSEL